MSPLGWKDNWEDTRRRFLKWWDRKGLMIGMWGAPEVGGPPRADAAEPTPPGSLEERWCDPDFRATQNHWRLARSAFPADVLPMADTDLGPGSLALFCGSEPGFGEETVWFHSRPEFERDPEQLPLLAFDPENRWWKISEQIIRDCVELSQGNYLVGCPDLVENIDTLCSLCGSETMCMSMIERPEWVEQKIAEATDLWLEVYQRIYDMIHLEDGSSAYGAFFLWGPGKTAKVQCDSSAMFSPKMYRRFIVPALTRQCEWLDHSLYHLDGTQAMHHLDAVLEIDALDAVEWTPQAGIESGGNPRWYDLYRKILAAGKSVQVVNVEHDEVLPLLDAIGCEGVYILTTFKNERDATELLKRLPQGTYT